MMDRPDSETASECGFGSAIARCLFAVFLLTSVGNAGAASFCYTGTSPCRDTLEEAEGDMRAAFSSTGHLLETKRVDLQAYDQLIFNYWVKPQPATNLYTPSYVVSSENGPNRLLNFAPAAPCLQTTNLRYRS